MFTLAAGKARTGRALNNPVPRTMDGLIYASSMMILDPARRGTQVSALARCLLGLGIVRDARRGRRPRPGPRLY
jgi:hypothetical protein